MNQLLYLIEVFAINRKGLIRKDMRMYVFVNVEFEGYQKNKPYENILNNFKVIKKKTTLSMIRYNITVIFAKISRSLSQIIYFYFSFTDTVSGM